MSAKGPNIKAIANQRDLIAEHIAHTPVVRCAAIEREIGHDTVVYGKLEFLQRTGTFKARGALATVSRLSGPERAAGVTAVSAGNHAIATAYAAKALGTTAKVVMIQAANPARVEACRTFGAEVVFAENVHQAFELVEEIKESEGRFFVHPFEGEAIALGSGGVGLEIAEQIDAFDVVLIPVGGGGLIGGMSNALRQLRPDLEILGIEPQGADTMHRSFASGKPEAIEHVNTIADSLGAPFALPYSFELTRANVDEICLVSDSQLRAAMRFLFSDMKLALEPACAATTAALLGPLREKLAGKRVVLTFCGSNIDWATFQTQAFANGID